MDNIDHAFISSSQTHPLHERIPITHGETTARHQFIKGSASSAPRDTSESRHSPSYIKWVLHSVIAFRTRRKPQTFESLSVMPCAPVSGSLTWCPRLVHEAVRFLLGLATFSSVVPNKLSCVVVIIVFPGLCHLSHVVRNPSLAVETCTQTFLNDLSSLFLHVFDQIILSRCLVHHAIRSTVHRAKATSIIARIILTADTLSTSSICVRYRFSKMCRNSHTHESPTSFSISS